MSDRLEKAYRDAEDRMAQMVRDMHERGELGHMAGKPLDIREDDPAWLGTRMLKQEGFSHPLLERRGDVQKEIEAADARIHRLMQRRERLLQAAALTSTEMADGFNRGRRLDVGEYARALVELNRSIRDYNLSVPTALHIRPVQVERQLERVEFLVPPLNPEEFGRQLGPTRWWQRLVRWARRSRTPENG